MNILEVTGLEETFLGLFLIAHGLIHLIFLFYFHDEETNGYTGWSGQSWLLDKAIDRKIVAFIGKVTWILIMLLFVVSGLVVLDLLAINDYLTPLIIISSVLATLAYIAFYDGLSPTPLHWILGVVINLVLIVFLIIFPNDIMLLLPILILIWLYGMLFHTKIIPNPATAQS
ncbi:MAG: hypothetical protein ACXABI_16855 [Candidatus Hodarchaeales archaeon]|jgi:hypothetical protein